MVEFRRVEIKEKAKEEFKNQYWLLVGYTALVGVIASAAGSLCGVVAIPFIGQVLSLAAVVCFVGPFGVACRWMYYKAYKGKPIEISDMFVTFKSAEIWKKTFLTALLVGVYTFLWSLLFLVPGIIKGYSYSMAPFLIMDDPTLTPSEAIQKSMEMTNGYKWELFIMDLSFMGWGILSIMSFGVLGVFWTGPYISLAKAGIYDRLLENQGPKVVNTTYTEV